MSIEELYKVFCECNGVSTDTRTIAQDSLFFTLKGENFDANDFVEQALQGRAKYVVADRPGLEGERIINVENALATLRALAAYHRKQLQIPMIAVTGTNGKTTTKELINTVLSTHFNTICTKGNLNNHIGVPLTLLGMNSAHQIAIVEMGASHKGEIMDSVNIASPDFGLITNVGKAHLEGFGSFEGVKETKGELYDFIAESGKGIFYNCDSPDIVEMVASRSFKESIAYGITCDKAEILPVTATEPFLRLVCHKNGRSIHINSRLVGNYNADNILAAMAVAERFGIPAEDAAKAIEGYVPSNSRSQMIKTADNLLIVDAYNANLTSMTVALDNFAKTEFSSKMLILGDMLELGAYSEEAHKEVLSLAHTITPEVILVGKGEFAKVASATDMLFKSAAELKEWLTQHPVKGKSILIKGSNSNKLVSLIENL
ncbi:MAG: UDP-N-acetylmuramoyl-tripeptide--D-alanyl-D-alanine ligase [Bacteroidales bacterium]|nr:UDP-N-acetylmuramoyl-tripeptide--D-alanyl-D-alanine ligase [Bacteroidales bacterium]